jgi:hypothetical protein
MKILRFHGKRRTLAAEKVSSFPEKKQKRLSASRILGWIQMRPRRATLFASFSRKRRALVTNEVGNWLWKEFLLFQKRSKSVCPLRGF